MKKIVGLVLILAGLALGFFGLPSLLKGGSPDEILNSLQGGKDEAIVEKITNIAENSVIEYDYTNAAVFESNEKLFEKIKIPFAKKKIIMKYDGKMKIGADMSGIEAEAEKDASGNVKSVSVTIPEIVITSNEVDRDSITFPVEKSTIINKIKSSDYDDLETNAREKIEKAVKASNTMDQAEEKLKENITGYLHGLYGKDVEVTFK